MERISGFSQLEFDRIKKVIYRGQSIECYVRFHDYQFTRDDKVSLWGSVSGEEEKCYLYQLVKEGELSKEDDTGEAFMKVTFEGYELNSTHFESYKFKYMTADLKVLAESNSFVIKDQDAPKECKEFSMMEENLTGSHNNDSQGKRKSLETECRLLRKELYNAHQKIELQNSSSKTLKDDKIKIAGHLEEEKRLRDKAECTVDKLEKCLNEKIEYIGALDVKIRDLEHTLRLETRMHDALREDFEGQESNNEEYLQENEHLKMKIIDCRREYVRLNKMNEDERQLYKQEFKKQEQEMLQLKHNMQQKLDNCVESLQDAKATKNTCEKRLQVEKERSRALENNLREISRDYEEQLELKEFEIAELKKQVEELEEILSVEREKKRNLTRDYESTIEELEKKLNSELKMVNTLTLKYKETQEQAKTATGEVDDLKAKLDKADRKMNEMEVLVRNSKLELEILQQAVSATEIRMEKEGGESSSTENMTLACQTTDCSEKFLPRSATRSQRWKEHTFPDTRCRLGKEKNASQKDTAAKPKHSGTKIMFNSTEPRRRFSGRRRSDCESNSSSSNNNNNNSYHYDRERPSTNSRGLPEKPDRQTGLLRQHRNSLLRENSRLRYSMKMLNHDCAILNFTLQQVVAEAEQKLESLYSLYMRKESECAAYEQMLAPASVFNPYDPYMAPCDYMETYSPDGAYVQGNAMVPTNYEQYAEGYYDGCGINDALAQQQVHAVDDFQYQAAPYQVPNQFSQVYFVPQMYFPQQIQYMDASLQLPCGPQIISNQQQADI